MPILFLAFSVVVHLESKVLAVPEITNKMAKKIRYFVHFITLPFRGH